ncbi:MAG: low affinity iron permease family protein [Hymenobacter sp.]
MPYDSAPLPLKNVYFWPICRRALPSIRARPAFSSGPWRWCCCGPPRGRCFKYSETWQLVINTSTTIVTFLMVFLIQRAQNKDSLVLHLKLNELLAATKGRQQPPHQRPGFFGGGNSTYSPVLLFASRQGQGR